MFSALQVAVLKRAGWLVTCREAWRPIGPVWVRVLPSGRWIIGREGTDRVFHPFETGFDPVVSEAPLSAMVRARELGGMVV